MANLFERLFPDRIKTQTFEALIDSVKMLAEDQGWTNARSGSFDDISDIDRLKLIQRSREYYVKHPAYRRIVSLNKSFVLGKGVAKPKSINPGVQLAIDKVWDCAENKKSFSGFKALETQVEQYTISGELFFKIYVNTVTGQSTIRVDRNMFAVKNVITDPEDSDKVLFYEYEYITKPWDPVTKTFREEPSTMVYIPHIHNNDVVDLSKYPALPSANNVKVYGLLATYGSAGMKDQRRGFPVYYQILPWLKAHKEVCEDAATFLKALSKIAWKKKYKNITKEGMAGQAKLMRTFTKNTTTVNTTPDAVGSTLLEGQGVENTPVEIRQNPQVFTAVADLLLQQVASGSDKTKHYFANPENVNLATATSMELPMIKDFERQQNELLEIVTEVVKFAVIKYVKASTGKVVMSQVDLKGTEYDRTLRERFVAELDTLGYDNVDIAAYAPRIVTKMFAQQVQGLVAAFNSGGITDKDFTYQLYDLLEYDNVDKIVEQIYGGGPGELKAGMDASGMDDQLAWLNNDDAFGDEEDSGGRVDADKKNDGDTDAGFEA